MVSEALGARHTTRGKLTRKLAWTALYSSVAAVATMAARRLASSVWRATTGEEPPARK
jgi:hypothetical protein